MDEKSYDGKYALKNLDIDISRVKKMSLYIDTSINSIFGIRFIDKDGNVFAKLGYDVYEYRWVTKEIPDGYRIIGFATNLEENKSNSYWKCL